ncbi:SpoIIE family protein phosphatase [Nocardioides sp. CER19]|uniref:SpoIIE family protein phosphatase n=1 Tax=Nocardioides sp. CER19 TaxID=3038538 RepID=UPI0024469681|nr:SpoIIE family protein phosphatase [Nocardioides sp. CER19]MDH2414723.1 SpoIIE family protein phosphatase [Nocardioides sp. CER19]
MSDGVPRVLVCDDTPAKRYVITSWLRRAGYTVIQTDSVAEALEVLREQPVDLAVLDVHLPDGSGLDIAHRIKSDPQTSSVPVIHISAVAIETHDRVAGLDRGGDAYLVDPIEPEEMLSTVRALLRSSGARRNAEDLATRTGRLNRAAVRLHLATTMPRLVEAAARAAAEVTDDTAAILVRHDAAALWAAAPSGGAEASSVVIDEARAKALVEAAERPVAHSSEQPWSEVLPVAAGDEWALWPVVGATAPLGFIAVPSANLTDTVRGLVERLAQLTSVAADNLLALEREHQTAMLLQRSLLPAVLPQPPGLSIAARYRASQRHAEVGGDFFDAFTVDDDCLLVIGDVQGHSLEAAVVMAELRYSLRAYAYDGHAPADVLDRVDTLLERNDAELIATACIAKVAADRRSLEIVSAGHLPILLCRAGETTYVETPGTLLGIGMEHEPRTIGLEPDDRLVLVTDGLVERRGEALGDGLERLSDAVRAGLRLTAEGLAQELATLGGASDDDVAILVVDITG